MNDNKNLFMAKTLLVIVILVSSIATFYLGIYQRKKLKNLYLQFKIKTSIDSYIIAYYDTGKGLNEKETAIVKVVASSQFCNVKFHLTNRPITLLRLDPINESGKFWLKDVKINDESGQLIQLIDLKTLKASHDIQGLVVNKSILQGQTKGKAKDPQLIFDISYPLKVRLINYGIPLLIYMGKHFAITFFSLIFCFIPIFALFKFRNKFTRTRLKKLAVAFGALILSTLFAIPIVLYILQQGRNSNQSGGEDRIGGFQFAFFNYEGLRIGGKGNLKLEMDPYSVYKNYPNQKAYPQPTLYYTIDKFGCRAGSVYKKNRKTAALVGGSAAFGISVADTDTFAAIISSSSSKYNIINAGVIGYLSGQELTQMLMYLSDKSPALFVVFDGWNDVALPIMAIDKCPDHISFGFSHSFFVMGDRLAEYYRIVNKGKPQQPHAPIPYNAHSDQEYLQKVIQTYLANVKKMNLVAKTINSRFLLVLQPEISHKKNLTDKEKAALNRWNTIFFYSKKKIPQKYRAFLKQTRNFCKQQRIPYIDMNQHPEFIENSATLFIDAVHFNHLGHQIIAKIINRYLEENF